MFSAIFVLLFSSVYSFLIKGKKCYLKMNICHFIAMADINSSLSVC